MLFVDEKSNLDKEALQSYVLKKLTEIGQDAEKLLHGTDHVQFWAGVHNLIADCDDEKKKSRWSAVEAELINVDKFIQGWIQTAVESKERFEFFVLTKAEEVRSGNQEKDYFWALQIRHDQLIALVEVMEEVVELMTKMVKLKPKEAMELARVKKMAEDPIEERIYLMAEKTQKLRQKHTK